MTIADRLLDALAVVVFPSASPSPMQHARRLVETLHAPAHDLYYAESVRLPDSPRDERSMLAGARHLIGKHPRAYARLYRLLAELAESLVTEESPK